MKSADHYFSILGVDSTATPAQLKQAYRDLVKIWHPDRFTHDPQLRLKAEAKLKEINEAYKQMQLLMSGSQWSEARYSRPRPGDAEKRSQRQKPTSKARPKRVTVSYSTGLYVGRFVRRFHGWWAAAVIVVALIMMSKFVISMTSEPATMWNFYEDGAGRIR